MVFIIVFAILTSVLLSLFSFNVFAKNEVSVYIDNKKIEFDVPPQIIDGRTLVPVRAVSNGLGAKVEWDGNSRTVYITSAKALANESK